MKEDAELRELNEKKAELLKKALELRDKLVQQQNSGDSRKIALEEVTAELSENLTAPKEISTEEERFIVRLVDATQQATGIAFNNVNKTWQRDNVWNYTAEVVMKVLKFNLDLTVDMKDGGDNEILDITCRFVNVVDYQLYEITPWVKAFTKENKMACLMSCFSDYNGQCLIRQKILDKLSRQKFITIDKCSTGGFFIYLHSPTSKKQFIKFLWTMQFNAKTRSIDHSFTIEAIDNDFMAKNENLLQDFCQKGLQREELETLWGDVCIAANEYKH